MDDFYLKEGFSEYKKIHPCVILVAGSASDSKIGMLHNMESVCFLVECLRFLPNGVKNALAALHGWISAFLRGIKGPLNSCPPCSMHSVM